mgnify:CR=1 FL=1
MLEIFYMICRSNEMIFRLFDNYFFQYCSICLAEEAHRYRHRVSPLVTKQCQLVTLSSKTPTQVALTLRPTKASPHVSRNATNAPIAPPLSTSPLVARTRATCGQALKLRSPETIRMVMFTGSANHPRRQHGKHPRQHPQQQHHGHHHHRHLHHRHLHLI